MKDCKEWTVECPWGKLALVSWGDPKNPPILLVHGYLDSAATFLPMLESLPDKYYYVGIDLPGHGKSDSFPASIIPLQSHMVESIRIAVNYLNWDRFIYLSHSMAFLIGLYYNAVFPGQIISFIALDPGPSLGAQKATADDLPLGYAWIADYYDNYDMFNSSTKLVKYEDVIKSVMKRRGFTSEQAALIMSRSLEPVGDGNFRLTINNTMKKLSHDQLPIDSIIHQMTVNQPSILIIVAEGNLSEWSVMGHIGLEVIKKVENENRKCTVSYLNGGHDFHVSNSVEVTSCVVNFLEKEARVRCKI